MDAVTIKGIKINAIMLLPYSASAFSLWHNEATETKTSGWQPIWSLMHNLFNDCNVIYMLLNIYNS